MIGTSQNEYSFRHTILSTSFEESTGGLEHDEKGISLDFFDLTTMAAATDNFSVANELGTGGFGSVYKVVQFPMRVQITCLKSMNHKL